jgi:hypothetical protein
LIEEFLDLKRFGDLVGRSGRGLDLVVFEDGIADGDALIADIRPRVVAGRGDELTDNVLALMAKRAAQSIVRSGTLQAVISCSAIRILLPRQEQRLSIGYVFASIIARKGHLSNSLDDNSRRVGYCVERFISFYGGTLFMPFFGIYAVFRACSNK